MSAVAEPSEPRSTWSMVAAVMMGMTEKKKSPREATMMVKPIPRSINKKAKIMAAIDAMATKITGLRPTRSESQPMAGVEAMPARVSRATCQPMVKPDISRVSAM